MGTVLSALLMACLVLAWRERPMSWFAGLGLATIVVLSWFFFTDITQPLNLSF
ncbi:hypothetical protein [Pusillimonas sp.]|uniref:hypothetical protein n=1 Tax=Pusillimonas sp. TaxID=3040095 RepID=UPI0037C7DDF2